MSNFIHRAYLSDTSVCDELIRLFTRSDRKTPGCAASTTDSHRVDKSIKASTDLSFCSVDIDDHSALKNYFVLLQEVCDQYIELYPTCNRYAPWNTDNFNIQHYAPGEGFHAWHCERGSAEHSVSRRHLVWMTYLNDVQDAGGTEFLNQKEVVQPRKGLTLIWPVDWTYTHRGIPSPTEHKYIITGWYDYV
jgi:hypothetical protein